MMFSVYCLQWSASGLVSNVWRCQIGPKVVNGRRTDGTITKWKGPLWHTVIHKQYNENWIYLSIKEQVDETRSIVVTHLNTYCLLKNKSTSHSKYAFNQNLCHFDDVSFRELFVWITLIIKMTILWAIRKLNTEYINTSS